MAGRRWMALAVAALVLVGASCQTRGSRAQRGRAAKVHATLDRTLTSPMLEIVVERPGETLTVQWQNTTAPYVFIRGTAAGTTSDLWIDDRRVVAPDPDDPARYVAIGGTCAGRARAALTLVTTLGALDLVREADRFDAATPSDGFITDAPQGGLVRVELDGDRVRTVRFIGVVGAPVTVAFRTLDTVLPLPPDELTSFPAAGASAAAGQLAETARLLGVLGRC